MRAGGSRRLLRGQCCGKTLWEWHACDWKTGRGVVRKVEKDGEEVDGKSIMGLMMLAAGHGSVISVAADGSDADAALDALADLIGRKFEEE